MASYDDASVTSLINLEFYPRWELVATTAAAGHHCSVWRRVFRIASRRLTPLLLSSSSSSVPYVASRSTLSKILSRDDGGLYELTASFHRQFEVYDLEVWKCSGNSFQLSEFVDECYRHAPDSQKLVGNRCQTIRDMNDPLMLMVNVERRHDNPCEQVCFGRRVSVMTPLTRVMAFADDKGPLGTKGFLDRLCQAALDTERLHGRVHRMIEPDTFYVTSIVAQDGTMDVEVGDYWLSAPLGCHSRRHASPAHPLAPFLFWQEEKREVMENEVGLHVPAYCALPRVAIDAVIGFDSADEDPLCAPPLSRMRLKDRPQSVSSADDKKGFTQYNRATQLAIDPRRRRCEDDDIVVGLQRSLRVGALGELVCAVGHELAYSLGYSLHQLCVLQTFLLFLRANDESSYIREQMPLTREEHQRRQCQLFQQQQRTFPLAATLTQKLEKRLPHVDSPLLMDGLGLKGTVFALETMSLYHHHLGGGGDAHLWEAGVYASPKTLRKRRKNHGDLARLLRFFLDDEKREENELLKRYRHFLTISRVEIIGAETVMPKLCEHAFDGDRRVFEVIRLLFSVNPDGPAKPVDGQVGDDEEDEGMTALSELLSQALLA